MGDSRPAQPVPSTTWSGDGVCTRTLKRLFRIRDDFVVADQQ